MAHRQRYHIDFFRHVADSSPTVTCLTAVVCTLVCILEIGAFVVCAGEAPFATEFNGAPTAISHLIGLPMQD
jgi:hypothetical protein